MKKVKVKANETMTMDYPFFEFLELTIGKNATVIVNNALALITVKSFGPGARLEVRGNCGPLQMSIVSNLKDATIIAPPFNIEVKGNVCDCTIKNGGYLEITGKCNDPTKLEVADSIKIGGQVTQDPFSVRKTRMRPQMG